MKTGSTALLLILASLACARQPEQELPLPPDAPPLEALFGPRLLNAKGEPLPPDVLQGKTVGIYFSAAWCPPCRTFTPRLSDAYRQLRMDGKPFEIVFVSSDADADAAMAYVNDFSMPWLVLPFGSPQAESLRRRFNVRGIPALAIVDSNGRTLAADARADVQTRGAAAFDRWSTPRQ